MNPLSLLHKRVRTSTPPDYETAGFGGDEELTLFCDPLAGTYYYDATSELTRSDRRA